MPPGRGTEPSRSAAATGGADAGRTASRDVAAAGDGDAAGMHNGAAADAGNGNSAGTDNGGAADAVIVIFGAAVRPGGRPSTTLHRRVEAAAAFGRRFAAPLFVPTGGVGRFGPSEASVMAALLESRGIASGRVLLEETGTDTLSSARAVARLLRARDLAAPVFAASSLYHLPRCVVLLRLAGVAARAAGPPWVPAGLRWPTRCYWWLREAAALPYDAALALGLRLRRRG